MANPKEKFLLIMIHVDIFKNIDEYIRNNNFQLIHRDDGLFGIIAPDFRENDKSIN